jgi:HSP20 family protein
MDEQDKKELSQGAIRITSQFFNIKLQVHPHAWHPATDLFETQEEYLIKIEIAGMVEDDFTVNVENNVVAVYGQRPLVNPDGAFHRLEIPYGDFSTVVEIPHDIDQEHIEAFYKNGFLTIRLPKAKPYNVKVN